MLIINPKETSNISKNPPRVPDTSMSDKTFLLY